jgi:hypothetical protein
VHAWETERRAPQTSERSEHDVREWLDRWTLRFGATMVSWAVRLGKERWAAASGFGPHAF